MLTLANNFHRRLHPTKICSKVGDVIAALIGSKFRARSMRLSKTYHNALDLNVARNSYLGA